MRSLPTSSMLRMTFFSIFTSCDSFFARSGPQAPAVCLRNEWPGCRNTSSTLRPRSRRNKRLAAKHNQKAEEVATRYAGSLRIGPRPRTPPLRACARAQKENGIGASATIEAVGEKGGGGRSKSARRRRSGVKQCESALWGMGCAETRGRLPTQVALAKEATGLGGRGRRRGVLQLRRRWGARLAHRVGAVHGGRV